MAIEQFRALRRKIDEVTQGTRLGVKDRRRANYGFVTEMYRAIYGEFQGVIEILTMAVQLHHDWMLVAQILQAYTNDFAKRATTHLGAVDEETQRQIKAYFHLPGEQA
jgi:hypothetical protein